MPGCGMRRWTRPAARQTPHCPRRGHVHGFARPPNRAAGTDPRRSRHARAGLFASKPACPARTRSCSARSPICRNSASARRPPVRRRLLADDCPPDGVTTPSSPDPTIAACSTAPSPCCARSPLGESDRQLDEKQSPCVSGPLGQPVGQPRRHDRARLRRPVDLLGQRARARRSHARQRLRTPAGVARHQRLLDQQRQRESAHPRRRTSSRRSRASPTRSGRGACASALSVDFGSPKNVGGLDTFDPLDPKVDRLVEGQGGRDLSRRARSGRLRHQGRFRRPRRSLGLRPHARRCGQRGGARARSRTAG